MSHLIARRVFPALALVAVSGLAAQQKAVDPKELPKLTSASPVGVAPGGKHMVMLRGLKLDTVTRLDVQEPKSSGRLLGKGTKAGGSSDRDRAYVGDSQIEIEVTIPPDTAGIVPLAVGNPAGQSPPYLLIVDNWPTVAEKEPNNGLMQAQAASLPTAIEGRIERGGDVDVYSFTGKAGQRVVLEVFASRCGGPLDPVLTLYDSGGRILASCDDIEGSADARLDLALPRDGAYFVSLIDAHDQGGPAHVYRLVLRGK